MLDQGPCTGMRPAGYLAPAVLAASLLAGGVAVASETGDAFASVGGVEISHDEFEREVYQAARQTYYHGRPQSEEDFLEFRRDVARKLVDRVLLLQEAHRRGLEPDRNAIEAQLAGYERQYGDTERWQRDGEQMLAAVRQQLEQDSLLAALEADVKRVPPADEEALRDYYAANPDKFTEPAQNRLSVILLSVAPSAAPATWSAARDEARRIVERARGGADFTELAHLHSSDRSAESGGDMGYVHQGMLSPDAEAAIASLDVGGISEPVRVLEGIAVFKLTGRRPAELRSFEDVEARAAELRARELGELQWEQTLARLRAAADVELDTAYLASLPGQQR